MLVGIPAAELEKKVGGPSVGVHRADLQALLVRDAGEGSLRLGAEVEGFEQEDASGVRVSLAGGSEERAEILVGADGVRSKIRATLFDPERFPPMAPPTTPSATMAG